MNITQLELWTSDLAQQRAFYADRLGLPVATSTDTQLAIQAGATQLIWTQAPADWHGCYHFAFNIPNNQFDAAKTWLSERVALIQDANGNDTFHSQGWNADNIYFYDPAGNIGELIARHTLDSAATEPFGTHALREVSEIGLASNDVLATVAQLQTQCGIAVYQDSSDTFAPVGDERGLFIVVKQGRIWFPDTGKPALFVPLQATIANDQGQNFTVHATDDRVTIEDF